MNRIEIAVIRARVGIVRGGIMEGTITAAVLAALRSLVEQDVPALLAIAEGTEPVIYGLDARAPCPRIGAVHRLDCSGWHPGFDAPPEPDRHAVRRDHCHCEAGGGFSHAAHPDAPVEERHG